LIFLFVYFSIKIRISRLALRVILCFKIIKKKIILCTKKQIKTYGYFQDIQLSLKKNKNIALPFVLSLFINISKLIKTKVAFYMESIEKNNAYLLDRYLNWSLLLKGKWYLLDFCTSYLIKKSIYKAMRGVYYNPFKDLLIKHHVRSGWVELENSISSIYGGIDFSLGVGILGERNP
jgi:hypothetical protein